MIGCGNHETELFHGPGAVGENVVLAAAALYAGADGGRSHVPHVHEIAAGVHGGRQFFIGDFHKELNQILPAVAPGTDESRGLYDDSVQAFVPDFVHDQFAGSGFGFRIETPDQVRVIVTDGGDGFTGWQRGEWRGRWRCTPGGRRRLWSDRRCFWFPPR